MTANIEGRLARLEREVAEVLAENTPTPEPTPEELLARARVLLHGWFLSRTLNHWVSVDAGADLADPTICRQILGDTAQHLQDERAHLTQRELLPALLELLGLWEKALEAFAAEGGRLDQMDITDTCGTLAELDELSDIYGRTCWIVPSGAAARVAAKPTDNDADTPESPQLRQDEADAVLPPTEDESVTEAEQWDFAPADRLLSAAEIRRMERQMHYDEQPRRRLSGTRTVADIWAEAGDDW